MRLNVVIQLGLREGALLGQGRMSCSLELGLAQLRFGLSKLASGLFQCGFEGAWINLKKCLTLVNYCTFLVILLHQVAAYLRPNFRVYVTVKGRDAFGIKRHVLLNDTCNLDLGRRGCSNGLLLGASG